MLLGLLTNLGTAGSSSIPPIVPVHYYYVQRRRWINPDTSQDSAALYFPVPVVQTRVPLVFNAQQNRYVVNDTTTPNLLLSTLASFDVVTGTLNTTNTNDTLSSNGTTSILGSVTYTNQNDTSSASGSPVVPGTLAYTNINDSLSSVGTTSVVGTVNYTNNDDTLAATGSVTAVSIPFFNAPIERVSRKRINAIMYAGRGQNASPPVIPTDPFVPVLFVSELRKPKRFNNLSFPNLLTSTFVLQQIASAYPEHSFVQKKRFSSFVDFPNLVISVVTGTVSGTLAYTNNNDTSVGTGSPVDIGTITSTNRNDTLVSSGTTNVSGSGSSTNSNDTLVASGSSGTNIVGTLNTTNTNDTSTGQGTSVVQGTSSTTNNNDSTTGQGSPLVQGSLARTNNNDTLAGFGSAGTPPAGSPTKLPMTGVGT